MIRTFRRHVIDGSILVIRVDLAQDFGPVELGQACIVVDHGGQRQGARAPGRQAERLPGSRDPLLDSRVRRRPTHIPAALP